MKIKKTSLEKITNVATGMTPAVYLDAVDKYIYEDGKRTDTKEATVVSCVCDGLGEVSLVFPPSNHLVEAFQNNYSFAQQIILTDIGVVEDVTIGIYDNHLVIKFQMREVGYE